MTAAHARTLCCLDCSTDAALAAHHDRLLTVDTDAEELLALLEMAVTWYELDYSHSQVVGPAGWSTFAQTHEWTDPERAERVFNLAVDIVGRAIGRSAPDPVPAPVIGLVRG